MTFFAILFHILTFVALAAIAVYALSKPFSKVRYFIDNTLVYIFTIAATLSYLGLIIYLIIT